MKINILNDLVMSLYCQYLLFIMSEICTFRADKILLSFSNHKIDVDNLQFKVGK